MPGAVEDEEAAVEIFARRNADAFRVGNDAVAVPRIPHADKLRGVFKLPGVKRAEKDDVGIEEEDRLGVREFIEEMELEMVRTALAGVSSGTTVSVIGFSPLTPGATYDVWVTGHNSRGDGPESNKTRFTA